MAKDKIVRRRFTEDEIQQGLAVLAWCGGNSGRAERELFQATGTRVTARTLEDWRKRLHPQRYEEARAALLPRLREINEAVAAQAGTLALEMLEDLKGKKHELTARELASSTRDVQTVAGIATDKANVLAGRPTEIKAHRNLEEDLKKLKRLGLSDFVEGSAEEIHEAAASVGGAR